MHDSFAALVRQLAPELGLSELPLDEDHGTQLVIDDARIVNIRLNPQNNTVVLFAALGAVEADRRSEVFQRALEANLFGRGTLGASLGYAAADQQLILSRELPLDRLEVPAFLPVLESFLNAAEALADSLSSATGTSDDASASPDGYSGQFLQA